MMQVAAIALGVRLQVLTTPFVQEAAGPVPSLTVGDVTAGDTPGPETVTAFARTCDVLTFPHGPVPRRLAEALRAEGVIVRPDPSALASAHDAVAVRRVAARSGLRWSRDEARPDRRGFVALVARSPSGQAAAWPVVETVRAGDLYREVIAPAPALDPGTACAVTSAALRIAGLLSASGVLAVEMLDEGEGGSTPSLAVSRVTPGPHDAGNWTVDGAVTDQFEQHLRAVLDLPLGDPRPRSSWSVTADVRRGRYPDLYRSYLHVMARDPGVKVHMDAGDGCGGRRVGHVTVCGDDLDDVRARARHAADFIEGIIDG
jgi:5-(carboxyamino)imidazole ribonucleotide synthase